MNKIYYFLSLILLSLLISACDTRHENTIADNRQKPSIDQDYSVESAKLLALVKNLYLSQSDPSEFSKKKKEIEELIEQNADVSAKHPENGNTALLFALQHSPAIVPLLIQAGAEVNIQNNYGVTPLMIAASRQEDELVHLFLEKGADAAAADNKGSNALLRVLQPYMSMGFSDKTIHIVNALLQKGVEVNIIDNNGNSPLGLAALHGLPDIVELLLQHGADPNLTNNKGWTPLMCAVKPYVFHDVNTMMRIVQSLINRNANVNAVNKDGDSALHLLGSFQVVPPADTSGIRRLLIENGANQEFYDSQNNLLGNVDLQDDFQSGLNAFECQGKKDLTAYSRVELKVKDVHPAMKSILNSL